jgi:hypothetical protein
LGLQPIHNALSKSWSRHPTSWLVGRGVLAMASLAILQTARTPTAGPSNTPKWAVKQGAFAAIWIVCLYVLYLEVPRLSEPASQALFIFYQPVVHILSMLWLWSAVIAVFETFMVRYEACFASEHLKFLLSCSALADMASAFTTVLALSVAAFAFCCNRSAIEIASYQPGLMYMGLLIILFNPMDVNNESSYGPQRWFFLRTVLRVFVPIQVLPQHPMPTSMVHIVVALTSCGSHVTEALVLQVKLSMSRPGPAQRTSGWT